MKKINEKYFEQIHSLAKGDFHRKVKPRILKYAKNNPYTTKEFHELGKNPDIALDKNNIVFLISRIDKSKSLNLKNKIDTFI